MLSLDELLLLTLGLALDAFDQYLVSFDDSLDCGGLIFFYLDAVGFLLDFGLFLYLGLRNESLRKGLEVRCEQNRLCPAGLLAPKTPELVCYEIVGSFGETAVLALAKLVVSLGYLPYYCLVSGHGDFRYI